MNSVVPRPVLRILFLVSAVFSSLALSLLLTGCQGLAGQGLVAAQPQSPTVALTSSSVTIAGGQSVVLTVTAGNATQVVISNNVDKTIYTIQGSGTQTVTPAVTTIYTALATSPDGRTASASTTVTVTTSPPPPPSSPTVSITANPGSIAVGKSSVLTVAATNANQVTVTGTDGSTYNLQASGGAQTVSPSATTTYTAAAIGAGGQASASTTLRVTPPGTVQSINHVLFLLQENRTFDTYFGMLNPFRHAQGWYIGDDGNDYEVDGIDDKLNKFHNSDDEGNVFGLFKFTSTCIDDMSSAWLESYGDVNRYNFSTMRQISMDGFVHTAEGYAKSGSGTGSFTDLTGRRAMGYYDQDYLNYYYYMASQFAISDRWFSPVSSKSIPNRIATFSGGTTQGLVRDPALDDKLGQLPIETIFQELQESGVSWKIYYTVTDDECAAGSDECSTTAPNKYPATIFTYFSYSQHYLYKTPPCTGNTVGSSAVGDTTNSFCIDPTHIAPLSQLFTDMKNGTLPSFAFIEAGYGRNDEHPGSGQSILAGQAEVAKILSGLMASPSWDDSVLFLSYDEGGGPFDHVPPVPGHSNDYTDFSLGAISDISRIAVNADSYGPCVPSGGTPTLHCDLHSTDPGAHPADAPAVQGFAAQLGFRVPNMIVSPFARRHYVSHTPMDHTAVIKFVESRFLGSSSHMTQRDAAQPDLLEFFDFNAVPWAVPPTPPVPVTPASLGFDPCHPTDMGP